MVHPDPICTTRYRQGSRGIALGAPAGWKRPDGPARIVAARKLVKDWKVKGVVLYLSGAEKRGILPAGGTVDALVACYKDRDPSVVARLATDLGRELPGTLPGDRVEALRRAARDHHATLAASAPAPHAAHLHAVLAARYGGPAPSRSLDPASAADAVPLHPRLVLPSACEPLCKGAAGR